MPDPALAFWQKANPGQTPNLPPTYNPAGGAAPAAPTPTPPPWQPISAQQTQQNLNTANADALGQAAKQNDRLREQAAGRGFGYYNPSLIGQQAQNLSEARGTVAQNNLNIPFTAAQYNATYGISGGQLAELQRSNQVKEQLGSIENQTNRFNALLKMLQGVI